MHSSCPLNVAAIPYAKSVGSKEVEGPTKMMDPPADMMKGPEEVEELTERMEGTAVMTTTHPSIIS